MRSLDTNVVLRVMVSDNEAQAKIAEAVMVEPTLLLSTVVLEAAWVLRRGYGWSAQEMVMGFDTLFDVPRLSCPDKDAIRWALDRSVAGADFADMLHLALSNEATAFATFDKDVARYADATVVPVETLS